VFLLFFFLALKEYFFIVLRVQTSKNRVLKRGVILKIEL